MIREAIHILSDDKEIISTAIVSRANKLKYPDECLAKISQIRNVKQREIYDTPEYRYN